MILIFSLTEPKKAKKNCYTSMKLVRRGKLEDTGNVITLFELMHEPPCISLFLIVCVAFLPHLDEYFASLGTEEKFSSTQLKQLIEAEINCFMKVLERKQIRIYKEYLPNELTYTREAMRQKLEDLSSFYFLVETKRLASAEKITLEQLLFQRYGSETDLLDKTSKQSTLRQLSAEVSIGLTSQLNRQ